MENKAGPVKEDALKPYTQRLKDKLDDLSRAVETPPTVVSSIYTYNRHIKQHLESLRSLRMENPAIHDEIIQNNLKYKQLFDKFSLWANPKKRSQVRLTPEQTFQELKEFLNNSSDENCFTEKKCSIKGTKEIRELKASAPHLFRDRRRKLSSTSSTSSTVAEKECPQTSHFAHKKFRSPYLPKD
jgi:hypothetical protein